ncbi:MAG: MBOAT family protein, partial [Treponema sp.]|nr:MBOAT family protein [Treponema sp.]
IYCDFSGYSDMAIGVARYLGFDVGKNFDRPYLSQSVGEFWRRWHISLSSWLRDYVYIPLGGSRVALPRIYLNLMATFLVSGIWHGSTWNFVIWGALHGLFLCAERATKGARDKMKIPSWINVAVTFCLVAFAWIFFRAKNISEAAVVVKKIAAAPTEILAFINMAKLDGLKEALHRMLSLTGETGGGVKGMAVTLAILAAFLTVQIAIKEKDEQFYIKRQKLIIRWAAYILLSTIISYHFFYNYAYQEKTNTEFLYFQF